MNSTLLTKVLLIAYCIILAFCVKEKAWARAEYWTGAILIVDATIRGMR